MIDPPERYYWYQKSKKLAQKKIILKNELLQYPHISTQYSYLPLLMLHISLHISLTSHTTYPSHLTPLVTHISHHFSPTSHTTYHSHHSYHSYHSYHSHHSVLALHITYISHHTSHITSHIACHSHLIHITHHSHRSHLKSDLNIYLASHTTSLFVAGTAFGDVAVSLFVAGAVFGEIWIDSRSAKCCIFQYKMRCRGGKSKLCERTGSVLQFHARIVVGSCSDHSRIVRHCK